MLALNHPLKTLFTGFFYSVKGFNSFEMDSHQNMDAGSTSPYVDLLWLSLETEMWILPLRCPSVVVNEQWALGLIGTDE